MTQGPYIALSDLAGTVFWGLASLVAAGGPWLLLAAAAFGFGALFGAML